MTPLAVLRPEPGNAATAARIAAKGVPVVRLPLFAVRPLAWTPPDPAGFDALLLTSANAARHDGPALASLATLPVLAVGATTADAARDAGLHVRMIGSSDAAALLADARAAGVRRPLHLGGRDTTIDGAIAHIPVYASDALPILPHALRVLAGSVALLHSARAAVRLGELADAAGLRGRVALAAISPAVARTAGAGWAALAVAPAPGDDALIRCAIDLGRSERG